MGFNNANTIIVFYRPACGGYFRSPLGELRQQDNNDWLEVRNGSIWKEDEQYEAHRIGIKKCIRAINKLSAYKHKIMVAIDNDVYPNSTFLKEFNNVTIMKSSYPCKPHDQMSSYEDCRDRLSHTAQDAVDAVDTEWVSYGWQTDMIPSKNWDLDIFNSIQRQGIDKVYAPMWIEGSQGQIPQYTGCALTPNLLWDVLRKERGQGYLTFPDPRTTYIDEQDFENFQNVARSGAPGDIVESCGDRIYAHAGVMIMQSFYLKKVGIRFGDWDQMGFALDNALRDICQLKKVINTCCYVWHPLSFHLEIRLPY